MVKRILALAICLCICISLFPASAFAEENVQTVLCAEGHRLEHHEAIEPSCAESGSIEYWQCSDCGKYYADNLCEVELTDEALAVPATGHSFFDGVCVSCGYTCAHPSTNAEGKCTECGCVSTIFSSEPDAGSTNVYTFEELKTVLSGNMFPNIFVSGDIIIPEGEALEISSGIQIFISSGSCLTLDGTLTVCGEISVCGSLVIDENGVLNVNGNISIVSDGLDANYSRITNCGCIYVSTGVEWTAPVTGNVVVIGGQEPVIACNSASFDDNGPDCAEAVQNVALISDACNEFNNQPQITYYNITYVLDGGINSDQNPDSYTIDTPTFKLANPTWDGFTFQGWYKDPAFKSKIAQISKGSSGDITLYAKWAAISYKITYYLNGGTNSRLNPTSYKTTSDDISFLEPTRKGYSFSGWYTDPGLCTLITEIPNGSFGSISIYAGWDIDDYSINYELNGGENNELNPEGYTIATPTFKLANPTRDGYNFQGWYKDEAFKAKAAQISKGSSGDITLYAKWAVASYKITYILNGGTNSRLNPTTYKITSDDIFFVEPTKKGHSFSGWFTGPELSTPITEIPGGSFGAVSVYAGWDIDLYSIKYELNGGENSELNPEGYTIATPTFKLANPTRDGYNFQGWYKDDAFKSKAAQISKGSSGDITLYAKWTVASYKISYVLNGGTNSRYNPKTYSITSDPITFAEPTRKGYSFIDWFTDPGLSTPITDLPSGSYGALTLYAGWEGVDYSISYELNGGIGNESNPDSYTVATPAIRLAAPTQGGYTFLGWYKDAAFKSKVAQIAKGSTGDITLYAKWAVANYKITYVLNGGTNSKANPKIYNIDSDLIAFENPTRSGFSFTGWFTDSTLSDRIIDLPSGSYGSLTLYAGWEVADYAISYELNGGVNSGLNPSSYTKDTPTIKLSVPTCVGYTFHGWYKDAAFKTKVTQIAKGSTSDITLYAKWDLTTYKISYVLNGGTNSKLNPGSYTVASGTIFLENPTRNGYVFGGWYSDSGLTNRISQISHGSIGNVTLYAKWTVEKSSNPYELKLGYSFSSGGVEDTWFKKAAEEIKSRTNGDVIIELWPNGVMGGEDELRDQVYAGYCDMCISSPYGWADICGVDAIGWSELPYIVDNYEELNELSKVLPDLVNQQLEAAGESENLICIGAMGQGLRSIFTCYNKPIYNMVDCQGITIRVPMSDVNINTLSSFGCSVCGLSSTEIIHCLQNGIIDGFEADPVWAANRTLYEVATNMTVTNHLASIYLLMINSDRFNALPKEYQEIVRDVFIDYCAQETEAYSEYEQEKVQAMVKQGLDVIELSDEAFAEFKAAGTVIQKEWLKQHKCEDIAAQARALINANIS